MQIDDLSLRPKRSDAQAADEKSGDEEAIGSE
jgi:hypothetical protein